MASFIFQLPLQGISKGTSSDNPLPGYSEYMNNVRARDVLEKKIRLGQRPGLDKWSTDQVGAAEQPVVAICSISSVT